MSERLRAVLREPLVHFLLIGAGLMAAWRWTGHDREPTPAATGRQIVVDDEVRGQLEEVLVRSKGRPASADELAEATARWIDDEVLYREGLARGLDRDDPAVRQRVAGKMALLLEQRMVLPAPSEAELRAWFDAHRGELDQPPRIDFTHVFVAGDGAAAKKRAAELLARVEGGADPDPLGDTFSGGRRYRGRKPADLAASFGAEFADGLDRQPPGTWRLRRSRHGLHLVRVDRYLPGQAADFTAAALDVRKQWEEARRAEAMAAEVRALRGRWQVVER
jgi:peptidyl-prolyl cis-trans isomerase C